MMTTEPENEPELESEPEPASAGVYNLMIHRTTTGSDPLVPEPLGDGG
jgi:hypothetical protein